MLVHFWEWSTVSSKRMARETRHDLRKIWGFALEFLTAFHLKTGESEMVRISVLQGVAMLVRSSLEQKWVNTWRKHADLVHDVTYTTETARHKMGALTAVFPPLSNSDWKTSVSAPPPPPPTLTPPRVPPRSYGKSNGRRSFSYQVSTSRNQLDPRPQFLSVMLPLSVLSNIPCKPFLFQKPFLQSYCPEARECGGGGMGGEGISVVNTYTLNKVVSA